MNYWLVNFSVVFLLCGYVFDVFAEQSSDLRIVSVNGALTEIVYELRAESSLVGVDTTSMYPTAATRLPQVGYQRNLSVEGILSLQPTHVLASAEAGPPQVLAQLKNSGVEILQFERSYSVQSVLERIDAIAQLVDQREQGDRLASRISGRYRQLNTATSGIDSSSSNVGDPPQRVLFFLGVGSGSPMVAGKGTAAEAMIRFAGGENSFADFDGYKPVSAEAIINADPQHILIVSHGRGGQQDVIDKVMQTPGVALTTAGKRGAIHVLDGLRFLGFGPRIANAIADLKETLYSPVGRTASVR